MKNCIYIVDLQMWLKSAEFMDLQVKMKIPGFPECHSLLLFLPCRLAESTMLRL